MHSGIEDPDSVELQTRLLQYRAGLFDPLTKLPTLPVVIDRVRQMLDERGNLHVLLVRIEHEQNLERIVGWERYDAVLGSVYSQTQHLQRFDDKCLHKLTVHKVGCRICT